MAKKSSPTTGLRPNSNVAPFLNDEEACRLPLLADAQDLLVIDWYWQAIVPSIVAEDGMALYTMNTAIGSKTVLRPTAEIHEHLFIASCDWKPIPFNKWHWMKKEEAVTTPSLADMPEWKQLLAESKEITDRMANGTADESDGRSRIAYLHALSRIPGARGKCSRCGIPDKQKFLDEGKGICRICQMCAAQRVLSDHDKALAYASQCDMHPATAQKLLRNGTISFHDTTITTNEHTENAERNF